MKWVVCRGENVPKINRVVAHTMHHALLENNLLETQLTIQTLEIKGCNQ